VQQYALKKLFRSAVDEAASGEGRVRGEALRKALGNFTPSEQNMLFPNNLRESLIHLSKDIEFLFPSDLADPGASIAAAEIKGHLPFKARAVGHWVRYAIENALVSRPELLQFLAGVRVYDPSLGARLSRVILRNLTKSFVFSQNTGPGEGSPSEAQ